ncbi:uncharacterized protein METZ01_LOCUS321190, partial [marine metagenome]
VFLPLAIAQTASSGRICEASSKITKSKRLLGGSTWETIKGDIIQQGFMDVRTSGANSCS